MNKAWETIQSFFQPPVFPDDQEKTRQTKILYAVARNLLFVLLLVLLVGIPFLFVEKLFSSLSTVLTLLVTLFSLGLARRGQTLPASNLLVSAFWLIITGLIWVSGGIYSMDILLYPAIIAVAGLLLGGRGANLFAALSLLALLALSLLERVGYPFPRLFAFSPLAIWVLTAMSIGIILRPLQITLSSLNEALRRFQSELDERRQAEANATLLAEERLLLYNFGIAITGRKNLSDTLDQVQAHLVRLLPNTLFFVALYDEQNDSISYPFFFTGKENLSVPNRKLSDGPGMTGAVISGRKTLYISDITTPAVEKTYKPIRFRQVTTHTFLGVPLIVNDQVIGVISIQHEQVNAFSQEQIRLFEALAVQVGIAIEHVRMVEQLQQELAERERVEAEVRQERDKMAERRQLLEKVIEIGKETACITDLNECLHKIHRSIKEELGFDRVGLFLYDAEKYAIQGVFGTDRQGNLVRTEHYARSIDHFTELKRLLSGPGGMVRQANYQETYNPPPGDEMYGVIQHLSVSAWAGENPVALIAVDNVITQRPIDENAVEALRLYTGYVGLAIYNSRLNTELEQRVRERTDQLELAMDELESFSYSVGHDLRAPLRGMTAFSQIIIDENGEQLSPSSKANLSHISHAAQSMGVLIDALLDFSRLTRAPLQRRAVNLSLMAENILLRLQRSEPTRQVRIKIQPDMLVNVDYKMFELVLKHLLENAWKFTHKSDNAEITFGETVIKEKRTFYVRDNGAGFNMSYSKKLFGAFQRLHREDEFPGHGAGLAIVQRSIRRHGGEIWGEGTPNEGATFYFTLS